MEKIVVKGVKELRGEVDISCAKNSILPIIAATIKAYFKPNGKAHHSH